MIKNNLLALLVIVRGGHHPLDIAFGSHFNLDGIGCELDDNSFSKVFFLSNFFFAHSLLKMALKLTLKIPIQEFL